MFKQRFVVFCVLLGALLFTMGCGAVTSLLGVGSGSGTVASLWSDVPKMDGMEEADLDIPLTASMMIKTFSEGNLEFIAYTTAEAPDAVREFYTAERMAGSGWNTSDMPGCIDAGVEGEASLFCIFGRDTDGKQEALAILASTEEGDQTSVYFARIDMTETEGQ